MASFLAVTGGGGYAFALQPPFDSLQSAGTFSPVGTSVAFSPDGQLLAVGHQSGVALIDTATWALAHPGISQGDVNGVAFSPDGQFLAVAHAWGLAVRNTSDWTTVSGTPSLGGQGRAVSFSPDGQLLAVTHWGAARLTVLETATWTALSGVSPTPAFGLGLAFSPDGNYLAEAYANPSGYRVLDVATFDTIVALPSPGGEAWCVAFSPDSQRLAVASLSGTRLRVVDTATWATITGTPSMPGAVYSVTFSPDGQFLAVAHAGGNRLTVINTGDWSVLADTATLPNTANGVAFGPDASLPARRVITYDHDGNPIAANAKLIWPDNWRVLAQVVTGADGEGILRSFRSGEMLAALLDMRAGVREYDIKPAVLGTAGDPPIELYLGYAGPLVTISGNATTTSGVQVEEVVVRAWSSRKLVARVYPETNGDWSAEVPPGRYDVTYIREGCEPINHGPYTVELPDP